VGGHKVDDLGRGAAGGANEIALVFAVFVIDHNHDLTGFDILNGAFDRV
jgi:hypothetical protein